MFFSKSQSYVYDTGLSRQRPRRHIPWKRLVRQLSIMAVVVLPMVLIPYWILNKVPLTLCAALLLVAGWFLTAGGVTIGFHRMMTHRSFTAQRPIKLLLLILGQCSMQGKAYTWAWVHLKHHGYSDKPGDPHSPYFGWTLLDAWLRKVGQAKLAKWLGRSAIVSTIIGWSWAHMGWVFANKQPEDAEKYGKSFRKDPEIMLVSRWTWACYLASYGIPPLIGWAFGCPLSAFVYGSIVRIFLVHHITWSINSWCHVIGKKVHTTGDQSRNVPLFAFVSLGEALHEEHHFKQRQAILDPRWYMDPSGAIIRKMAKWGWITDVHGMNGPA